MSTNSNPDQQHPDEQSTDTPAPESFGAVERDPDAWVTGDETMTGPQASYLQTLTHEAGEEFDQSLSKADASKEIDRLQEETGRGT